MAFTKEQGAWVDQSVVFAGKAHIGFCSCIGRGAEPGLQTYIGEGVTIGAFCVIEAGARLEAGVEIDHYCRVGAGSIIGRNTKILYGAQVFDRAHIGDQCIIGGHVIDRAVIEDRVTYSGNMAHLHSDATNDWDSTEEPSPTIRRGSVIGVGALIIGAVTIGPRAYVAAGEIVRCNVAEETVLLKGDLKPLTAYHGMIKVRE